MDNNSQSKVMPCLLESWHLTEPALFGWLMTQCGREDLAFDLLQETFLRGLQQKRSFCEIENQKAWLFRVARNLLTDEWRRKQRYDDVDEIMEWEDDSTPTMEPIDSLAQCLPKALMMLSAPDRQILEACDIAGESQQQFALRHGLSLSAAKSRIQRARSKLRMTLKVNCQIHYDDHHKVCCIFPADSF
jgi:RNA polymerase sigma-70 factor (ECF subfamily)